MQGRTIKGRNKSGGRWMEISRRKRRMDAVGGLCTVSVGCAVYSLISSARKVLRGGRRGETLFSVSIVMLGVNICVCVGAGV